MSTASNTTTTPSITGYEMAKRTQNKELLIEFGSERFAWGEGEDRVIIGNGWYVDAAQKRRSVTIKGRCRVGDMKWGTSYRLWGRWVTHEKYGLQFHFSTFVRSRALGRSGVIRFLQTVPRIGPMAAASLYDRYGDDAMNALRNEPEEISQMIRGLTVEAARAAGEQLRAEMDTERLHAELMGLLGGRGFPQKTIDWCIQRWGNRSADAIRDNPYSLLECSGVGFLRADRLYLDMGKDPAAIERQVCCLKYGAEKTNGDTWRPYESVHTTLKENITSDEARMEEAVREAVELGLVECRADSKGERWIATTSRAAQERTIADRLSSLLVFDPSWPTPTRHLYDHQRERLQTAFERTVCCLIGTPGTGKSYVLGCVAGEAVRLHGLGRVAVVAPTGKAAVRSTELMQELGVPLEATTIHRLLGVGKDWGDGDQGDDDGDPASMTERGWRFHYGGGQKLPFRYIFVDEASMCDTFIVCALLEACAPGTHIMFVGDTNQLPPVGHGSPLKDMILAGLPCAELTEIIRNDGQIVRTCQIMRQERRFEDCEKWDLDAGRNLKLVHRGSPATQIACLEDTVQRIGKSARGLDPVWDCQVICAVNQRSPLSRIELNTRLQGILNPHGAQDPDGKNPFRVGDKIINWQNSRMTPVEPGHELADDKGKVYVANGEMAKVLEVLPNVTIAEVQNPSRVVKIFHGKRDAADAETETGCQWTLAYAVSSHKCQGSEWPVVIVMADDSHGASRICDLSWLYTAISRAKLGCLVIGRRSTVDEMCRRSNLHHRKTFLVDEIGEKCGTFSLF